MFASAYIYETATQSYYGTLFHELVHWTMLKTRCNRTPVTFFNMRYQQPREELIAELGAVILLKHFGMYGTNGRGKSHHTAYFLHWLSAIPEKQQKYAIAHAKREAEQAVRFILES